MAFVADCSSGGILAERGPAGECSDLVEPRQNAEPHLIELSNVGVVATSACEERLPEADVIYVNAGATHPLATWLDALKIGGRLIFPMTTNSLFGVMLLVTRKL
jgi:protein-L-isoaspartate(D-aspartate) O-methyltransferase